MRLEVVGVEVSQGVLQWLQCWVGETTLEAGGKFPLAARHTLTEWALGSGGNEGKHFIMMSLASFRTTCLNNTERKKCCLLFYFLKIFNLDLELAGKSWIG